MRNHSIHPDDIEIMDRHRALDDEAVARLAASMRDIGLRQPVTVRIVDEMLVDGELTAGVPVLVAGAHRLAAAKSLGWSHIDCIEIDDDAIKAELWEIAENLHRCELTAEQRHAHLRRYAELVEARLTAKPVQDGQVSSGGRGNKSVARIVADETGVSLNTVKRATGQIARPAPEPKAALPDHDVFTVQFNALMAAWNRAGPDVREAFIAEIDGPVFDNTRAAA